MRRIKSSNEFDRIISKIKSKENFALVRMGSKEAAILSKKKLNLSNIFEFNFDPQNQRHLFFRNMLIESYKTNHEKYIVGMPCYCCTNDVQGNASMGLIAKKKIATLATVFSNNNSNRVKELLEALNGRNIILLSSWKAASVQNPALPLNVRYSFRLKDNGVESLHIISEMKKFVKENKIKNYIFLFSAGPLSNIIINALFQEEKENCYLNIGSMLDPLYYGRPTRDFHKPDSLNNHKICVMDLVENSDAT